MHGPPAGMQLRGGGRGFLIGSEDDTRTKEPKLRAFNGSAAFDKSEGGTCRDGRRRPRRVVTAPGRRAIPLGHPDNTASSGSIIREASVTLDPSVRLFPDGSD